MKNFKVAYADKADVALGASADDIVRIVQQCIAVLQGDTYPKANPYGFSSRIALILLPISLAISFSLSQHRS